MSHRNTRRPELVRHHCRPYLQVKFSSDYNQMHYLHCMIVDQHFAKNVHVFSWIQWRPAFSTFRIVVNNHIQYNTIQDEAICSARQNRKLR